MLSFQLWKWDTLRRLLITWVKPHVVPAVRGLRVCVCMCVCVSLPVYERSPKLFWMVSAMDKLVTAYCKTHFSSHRALEACCLLRKSQEVKRKTESVMSIPSSPSFTLSFYGNNKSSLQHKPTTEQVKSKGLFLTLHFTSLLFFLHNLVKVVTEWYIKMFLNRRNELNTRVDDRVMLIIQLCDWFLCHGSGFKLLLLLNPLLFINNAIDQCCCFMFIWYETKTNHF